MIWEDSIEIKIERDELAFKIELDFTSTKGHISYDYFQPSEPDETEFHNIKINGYEVSDEFYKILIDEYEDLFYCEVDQYLNDYR